MSQTLSITDKRGVALSAVLSDEVERKAFTDHLSGNSGNVAETLKQLSDKLPSASLQKLQVANSLAEWTGDNASLVARFAAHADVRSLRDVALKFGAAELAKLITAADLPPDLSAGVHDDRTAAYAAHLQNGLFKLQTSAVLQRMVSQNEIPLANDALRAGVAGFFDRHPDYNIRTTSVLTALKQPGALDHVAEADRPAVAAQLKTLQRVQAISHVPEAVPALIKANISSATRATELPETTFLRAVASSLDTETARVVHANALGVQIRNEQTLATLRHTVRGTGIGLIDAGATPSERALKAQASADTNNIPLNLGTLFGSLDECECDDCLSVYSPAAYFVELLQYLRNNDLGPDPASGDPAPGSNKNIHPGIVGTALEKLFRRRPDLGCLELSCENTFTVLPYIDLVDEVMESFVVHAGDYAKSTLVPKQVTLDTFNVEDETTGELLAMPQHTNYGAYCILKSAVYPFSLPYHQPIDSMRILLQPLGTSRAELFDAYRTPTEAAASGVPEPTRTELAVLHQAVIERAIDAETLDLVQEEYIILTEEAFWPKRYFDLTQNKAFTDIEYHQQIGVRPVWEYYGYASEAAMMDGSADPKTGRTGLSFVKWQFLPRTGLLYTDLVALLLTRWVNPNYPQGLALAVLEAIPFSYRFLQTLVDGSADNPQNKYAKVVQAILEGEALRARIAARAGDGPCRTPQLCAGPPIDEATVRQWVLCWFERLGKLIVLESGEGPQFGIAGDLFAETAPPRLIGRLEDDGRIIDPAGALIGQVDAAGVAKTADGKLMTDMFGGEILIFDANGMDIGAIHADGITGTRERRIGWLPTRDTCDIDKVRLLHLDGSAVIGAEYDRMQRFIRLWRRLGWSIDATDRALEGMSGGSGGGSAGGTNGGAPAGSGDGAPGSTPGFVGFDEFRDSCANGSVGWPCAPSPSSSGKPPPCPDPVVIPDHLSPDMLHRLRAVKELLTRTGLPLANLLAFWAPIGTRGDASLYRTLFLSHAISSIDPVFEADANGGFLTGVARISEHLPVLMAALRVSADDVTATMALAGLADELTIATVSALYRYAQLARLLQVRVALLKDVADLFGNPFGNPWSTLGLLRLWQRMQDAGFTFRQVDWVIQNRDDALRPLAPSRRTLLVLAKALYDGLAAIRAAHPNLGSLVAANPGQTAEDLATDDLVRAKASLIFDAPTVDQIAALLDGTTVYVTNAPGSLTVAVPAALAAKVAYLPQKAAIPPSAVLQVTGILTAPEVTSVKALSNHPDWPKAVDRIAKQSRNLFNDVLFGVSSDSVARATLLSGDFTNPSNAQDPANTAPVKRVAFLTGFIPFLIDQLAQKLIVDRLSALVSLPAALTRLLLNDILAIGTPPVPAMQVFKALGTPPTGSGPSWSGYLIPPADGAYLFTAIGDVPPPAITLAGQTVAFTIQQEDPSNVWSSAPASAITLKAGQLYRLEVTDRPAGQLQWKTARHPRAPIPDAALLPDYSSDAASKGLLQLAKSAIVIKGFSLDETELVYFRAQAVDFAGLDLNALTLVQWTRLLDYTGLRDALPRFDLSLIDLFDWATKPDDPTKLAAKIASATGWRQDRITSLIEADHFDLDRPGAFRNEINLIKLAKALDLIAKLGVESALLFNWAEPGSKFWACHQIAEDMRKALRARYAEADWEAFIKPYQDTLREHQKQALIAWLLVQPALRDWGVADADGLFEFFLIDVQMDACMETSRIKQAISSVQLFVQRCMLGLEERKDGAGAELGVATNALDRDRWSWMQRYRVWQANREVFLYPENWLKPELRNDKSEFYKELESQLLRRDVSPDKLQDALLGFVHQVHDVANLKVVGLHQERAFDASGTPLRDPQGNFVILRLHVFARTRTTPFVIYRRRYEIVEGNWYPWETVPVDVPSYEVLDGSGQITERGTYLLPVCYYNRLFIFFPEFTKKPIQPDQGGTVSTSKPDPSGNIATQSTPNDPKSRFEIKMGWSELRNGAWTPKKVSSDALYSAPFKQSDGTPVYPYYFLPDIDLSSGIVLFYTAYTPPTSSAFFRYFENELSGAVSPQVFTISPLNPNFQYVNSNRITSAQVSTSAFNLFYFDLPRVEDNTTGSTLLLNASISYTLNATFAEGLMRAATSPSITAVTDYIAGPIPDPDNAFGAYVDQSGAATHHELKRPNAILVWEAGFHAQMAFVDKQVQAGQFEAALATCQTILSPFVSDAGSDPTRYWKFPPFRITVDNLLEQLFTSLQPGTPYGAINEWRNNPFQPHVVARSRPAAYMMWVAMTYIRILIAWGDSLFRQDTIESINAATQLYVLAAHVYGPRRQKIPKRGKVEKQTYYNLLDRWDAFGNAMVELELAAPFSNQTPLPFGSSNGVSGFANVFGFATTLYFCIPDNPDLTALRDTIDDRLFKIRNCENIAGVFRQLPLFDPPIDPGLLVEAAAQGVSIATVLSDLNSPMPNYRLLYLLQKALELCNELKSLGTNYLSAREKSDGEGMARLRAGHESSVNSLVLQVRQQQADEAQKTLDSLEQNRKGPVYRLQHYLKLIGEDLGKVPEEATDFSELDDPIEAPISDSGVKLISSEKDEMDKADAAEGWQVAIGLTETLASILHIIPSFDIKAQPFGIGMSSTITSGWMLGNAAQAVARGMQTYASSLTYQSSSAGRKAGFLRQLQERVLQANAAGYEIKSVDKQIVTQKIRLAIANNEIDVQQKQVENSAEVADFLRNKYSGQELYDYMAGQVSGLYYQLYSLAYEIASRAEKLYRFERGIATSNFIQYGYWDPAHDGLLAGERLYLGLKQLESAYQETRGYDFEVTKTVSLQQLDPLALMQLRESGSCEFELPEVLFDMGFPGHYKRRIKLVTLTFSCLVGPATSVNCELRLLNHRFRFDPSLADGYSEKTDGPDPRFMTTSVPITAVAVSGAQNDGGLFELNYRDERYLPFEGAGAISRWRVTLPQFREFDYETITELVIRGTIHVVRWRRQVDDCRRVLRRPIRQERRRPQPQSGPVHSVRPVSRLRPGSVQGGATAGRCYRPYPGPRRHCRPSAGIYPRGEAGQDHGDRRHRVHYGVTFGHRPDLDDICRRFSLHRCPLSGRPDQGLCL